MGFANSTPFEVIAAPFKLYLAPVGTAFPLIDAAPAVDWLLIGSSGDLNYHSDGVTVEQMQTISKWRSLGDSGSRKVFRQEEDLMIRLTLVDITLEQYKYAINSNSVATTAAGVGTAGFKTLGLSRGLAVATNALLLRGPSPYGDDWTLQYEVPRAAQSGNPTVVYQRQEPAGLALEWSALVDPSQSASQYFGRIVAQHAAPLP